MGEKGERRREEGGGGGREGRGSALTFLVAACAPLAQICSCPSYLSKAMNNANISLIQSNTRYPHTSIFQVGCPGLVPQKWMVEVNISDA